MGAGPRFDLMSAEEGTLTCNLSHDAYDVPEPIPPPPTRTDRRLGKRYNQSHYQQRGWYSDLYMQVKVTATEHMNLFCRCHDVSTLCDNTIVCYLTTGPLP